MNAIINFLDRLEDKIRGWLSHYPIIYALVSGIGVILFWRGVWELADFMGITPVWSMIIGFLILLSTGIMVAHFLGSRILISGLRGEKKLEEKTLREIESEENALKDLKRKVEHIDKAVRHLSSK